MNFGQCSGRVALGSFAWQDAIDSLPFSPKPASAVRFKQTVGLIAISNGGETLGLAPDNLLDDFVEANGN